MRHFGLLAVVLCCIGVGFAITEDADTSMYFESSGDGVTHSTNPALPYDDEDTDEDGSGNDIVTDTRDDDTDIEEIDVEPEIAIRTNEGKSKINNIDENNKEEMEVTVEDEEEKPEEKDVTKIELDDEESEVDGRSLVGSAGSTHFLAAVIVGGCIGLLFAICVIMLLVYRMRKKDEGSYALEYGLDGKKTQGNYDYTKGVDSKEYFA